MNITNKKKGIIFLSPFCAIMLICAGIFTIQTPFDKKAYATDATVFIFSPTSDTECSVRLSDKTVQKRSCHPKRLSPGKNML